MFYTIFSLIVVVLAIILAIWVVKFLFKRHWLLGWLRGTVGLCIAAVALVLLLVALDLFTYRQLFVNKAIATISFSQRDDQLYDALLIHHSGNRQIFELQGDQWQMDARIFQWAKTLHQWGVKPGYRLDRISGRYLSLDDENTKKRTVYALSDSPTSVDIWSWLKSASTRLPIVNARYGSATFLPMVDNGQYEIALSANGLLARPVNEPAKAAVEKWR